MTTIAIDVRGLPHPQGSMKAHPTGNGKVAMRYPPAVWQWRNQVQQAVAEKVIGTFTGPIELWLGFDLPRPQTHYGSGGNTGRIRPSAPAWPTVRANDLDKLVRCICDAITDAGLWRDDSQVVVLHAAKRYIDTPPGVLIKVRELDAKHHGVSTRNQQSLSESS